MRTGQPLAIKKSSIRALQIKELPFSPLMVDHGMAGGNVAVVNNNIVMVIATDANFFAEGVAFSSFCAPIFCVQDHQNGASPGPYRLGKPQFQVHQLDDMPDKDVDKKHKNKP